MNNKLNKHRLKLRYSITGLFIMAVVIYLGMVANYELVMRNLMYSHAVSAQHYINDKLLKQSALNGFDQAPQQVGLFIYYVQRTYNNKQLRLFDSSKQLLSSTDGLPLKKEKQSVYLQEAFQGKLSVNYNLDAKTLFTQMFLKDVRNNRMIAWYIPVKTNDKSNILGVVALSGSTAEWGYSLGSIVIHMWLTAILSLLCLFVVLYWMINRADKTIRMQSKALKDQILRLSNILAINKSMQNNMRSASSRAVELNEQFLRRVGSDLHDGPAQSIGYALLRIDKVNQQEQSRVFNQEYHTVKDALTSALEEIRGISSGLVLPELDSMTLTQSLKRVVKQHVKNTKTEVKEYYKDLPDHVPLPIQICAYRFVQEGLNNAHRHGEAMQCRLFSVFEKGELRVSLKDNGKGFRAKKLNAENSQLGLLGLKDRVESLGGTFDIDSELGVGSTIKMSILIGEENN